MKRKLLSILLTLCMMLTLLPATALAEEPSAGAGEEGVECTDDNCSHVAKIDNKHYTTLAAAVAAVPDSTETEIVLLDNASGCGIIVPGSKKITFNLNDKTYTVKDEPLAGSEGTKSQCFQLLKGSTITIKNGEIVCAEGVGCAMIIQNYATLTLDNMTLDGKNLKDAKSASTGNPVPNYTLSNNCGTILIKDSTIKARDNQVAFDVDYQASNYPAGAQVTVENSTIIGKIEIPARAQAEGSASSLTINSGSFTDLANAVKYAADGATIKLADNVTVNCPDTATDGSGAIDITKNLTIDGNSKTITAGTGFALNEGGTRGKFHMFNITNGANVTIQNLTIDGAKSDSKAVRSGINLYGAGTVNINTVTVKDCSTYGVTVNGSTAVINGLTTSGNGWGGVNVDNKLDSHTSSLTISSCNLGEAASVYFENASNTTLTANLTGGTYKGVYAAAGITNATISITGGTFSTDPSTYVASDYIVMKTGESAYTVVANSGLTSGTYLSQPNVASGYYVVDNGNGTYTVQQRSYSGGSSSSSSSSSSNTTSSTVKNPDGSTTTTTTNKTTGTTTEVTKNTDGSVDTVTTNKDGSTTETTKTAGGTTATVETDKNGNTTSVSASVSSADAKSASKAGESVTLPLEGIEPVSNSEDASEINVSIPSGSSSVTVEIPVENVTPGTVVVIVNEDGTETIVPTSKVTENGIEVTLTEDATIKIIDNSKSFSDVPADNVFSDEIASMSARGIMVGKEDGSFDVHGSVTLNQIANVAGRVSGAVATEDYEGGIAWGKANGLATGDAPATRGQVILALYVAAGSPDAMDTGKLSAYSDGAGVPSELLSAVLWAVEHGILKGTDVGTLDLGANVTRGQAAAFAGRALSVIG